MILAPLRGVTIRCFREVFADVIRDAGFTEAITPFVPANRGYDPLKDRELRNCLNVRMLECSNEERLGSHFTFSILHLESVVTIDTFYRI